MLLNTLDPEHQNVKLTFCTLQEHYTPTISHPEFRLVHLTRILNLNTTHPKHCELYDPVGNLYIKECPVDISPNESTKEKNCLYRDEVQDKVNYTCVRTSTTRA